MVNFLSTKGAASEQHIKNPATSKSNTKEEILSRASSATDSKFKMHKAWSDKALGCLTDRSPLLKKNDLIFCLVCVFRNYSIYFFSALT